MKRESIMNGKMRTRSSVTAATDGSPKCVTWNWADTADPESVDASVTRTVSEPGPLANNSEPAHLAALRPSFTMVEESFQPSFESFQPSFTVEDESSQVRDGAPPESAKNHKQEWKELCWEDGENHEVEWNDFAELFGNDEVKDQEVPECTESSRGMKKFMSRVTLNPKLKNFMSSRHMGKDDKVAEVSVCGESVEMSLLEELDQSKPSFTGHESNLAIIKGGTNNADKLEVVHETVSEETFDETVFDGAVFDEAVDGAVFGDVVDDAVFDEAVDGAVVDEEVVDEAVFDAVFDKAVSDEEDVLKMDVCTPFKSEEDCSNDDTASNTKSDSSKPDVPQFDSREKEGAKGMKKLLSQVKLNTNLSQMKLNTNLSQVKLNPGLSQVKLNRNFSQVKLNSKLRSFRRSKSTAARAAALEHPKNDTKQSEPLTSDEFEVETYAITRAIYDDILAKDREAAVLNAYENKGDKPSTPEATRFDSGEEEGDRGIKRLMSRVKLNSKLRSYRGGKAPDQNHEETLQLLTCVTSDEPSEHNLEAAKEEVSSGSRVGVLDSLQFLEVDGDNAMVGESGCEEVVLQQSKQCVKFCQNEAKIVLDDGHDDGGDEKATSFGDELETLNEDASHITVERGSKAVSSCIDNMSVFHDSEKGSEKISAIGEERVVGEEIAEEETALDEQQEKPLEFRQMEITLKFKALAGVSQVASQRKPTAHDGDGTVKAVVTYRRTNIASDRFVSTHVPSLPIVLEQTPHLASAQVYAQWPGGFKDDDSKSTAVLLSSVNLTRTVRRVRNLDNLSNGVTVAGSQAKKPEEKDSKQFLASLSKAFAPELLDLQVGLMRGSSEIIPLGIATVVIPGEYKRMELDIPVVRNYHTGENGLSKNKISQIRGMTKSSRDHVFFSADKGTKYKVGEGAFLRLELNIEPSAKAPAAPFPTPPYHLNKNTRKTDFKSGPITQALRSRRKMDQLLSSKKLPLHQRIQLYLELRNRKASNVNKASPDSKEVFIARQTEVSDVSCEMRSRSSIKEASEVDDMTESLLLDQYETRSWASSAPSKSSNSLLVSKATADADELDGRLSPKASGSSASVTTAGTNRQDGVISVASEHSGASANHFVQPNEDRGVSASSFPLKKQDGRLSPGTQCSGQGENQSQFSSSLYSVFTTNHPQKQTIAQNLMDILLCEPNDLGLCEKERNALKFYAHDHEEKIAQYCQEEKFAQYFAPYFQDEFSIQDTSDADEDTLGSLESLSVNR